MPKGLGNMSANLIHYDKNKDPEFWDYVVNMGSKVFPDLAILCPDLAILGESINQTNTTTIASDENYEFNFYVPPLGGDTNVTDQYYVVDDLINTDKAETRINLIKAYLDMGKHKDAGLNKNKQNQLTPTNWGEAQA